MGSGMWKVLVRVSCDPRARAVAGSAMKRCPLYVCIILDIHREWMLVRVGAQTYQKLHILDRFEGDTTQNLLKCGPFLGLTSESEGRENSVYIMYMI